LEERKASGLTRPKPTREEALALVDAATRISWHGEDVPCPRCGKILVYEQLGGSFTVSCPDIDCIETGGRGI